MIDWRYKNILHYHSIFFFLLIFTWSHYLIHSKLLSKHINDGYLKYYLSTQCTHWDRMKRETFSIFISSNKIKTQYYFRDSELLATMKKTLKYYRVIKLKVSFHNYHYVEIMRLVFSNILYLLFYFSSSPSYF